ncbi:MAG: methyltransferase domain-containing protein [Candidatus Micrarchaeia archaeon]
MKLTQNSDNEKIRTYQGVLSLVTRKRDCKVLNLGSGTTFNFEKEILAQMPTARIVSSDRIKIKEVPTGVKYLQRDVERLFDLDEKFDFVTFFELIEHIDNTDALLKNCAKHLKKDGLLIFSFPNLASIFCRIELALGYQPHILEVSNEKGNCGTGVFSDLNSPKDNRVKNPPAIHHIRGITSKAMMDLLQFHGFKVVAIKGYSHRADDLFFRYFPSIAPVNVIICKKNHQKINSGRQCYTALL